MIRFGKGGERLVPVKLGARLTETGTLETWCDSKISENRWRLQFQLRKSAATMQRCAQARRGRQCGGRGCRLRTGARDIPEAAPSLPKNCPPQLEAALGLGRNSWPVEVARRLADVFLELIENRENAAPRTKSAG